MCMNVPIEIDFVWRNNEISGCALMTLLPGTLCWIQNKTKCNAVSTGMTYFEDDADYCVIVFAIIAIELDFID